MASAYFAEAESDYHIAAAGSLLGVARHAGASFPVGKVDHLDLHPLGFAEFALAMGEREVAGLLEAGSLADIELCRPSWPGSRGNSCTAWSAKARGPVSTRPR